MTKLINIKEYSDTETTRIKAIYCPFTLAGSTEQMQVAWGRIARRDLG